MTVQAERRSRLRKRPLTLVYVELDSMNGGMMRDISEEGFALRAMIPLRAEAKTAFSFSLDASTHVKGEAKVIWLDNEGRVAGLTFTQISQENSKKIRDWLLKPDESPTEEITPKSTQPEPSHPDQLPRQDRSLTAKPADLPPPGSRPDAPLHSPESKRAPFTGESKTTSPAKTSGAKPSQSRPSRQDTSAFKPPELPPDLKLPDAKHSRVTMFPGPPPPPPPISWHRPAPSLEPLPALEQHYRDAGSGFTLGRAVAILLLIALATTGYVYREDFGRAMIQFGQQISGAQRKTPAETAPSAADAAPSRSAASPGTAGAPTPNPSNSPAANSQHNASSSGSQIQGEAPSSASENSSQVTPPLPMPRSPDFPANPVTSRPSPAANAEPTLAPGQNEYLQALQIIRAKNHSAQMWRAVRLLWTAVEKGNSDAEVVLAELYHIGDGVAKNCDQTRVLLTAASRKGNAEAVRRLHLFEREACED